MELRTQTRQKYSIVGAFAHCHGLWKIALCAGCGGWFAPRDSDAKMQRLPNTQLRRIGIDNLAEWKNLLT